jgi:hypothetical protein
MKVRCIQTEINKDKKSLFGIDADFDPCFQITIGKECTVFGISIIHGKSGYSGLVMYEILDDVRSYCISMPHCLFEIIDGRASSYWEIRINNEDITIWPEDFFCDYFFDDLSDGEPLARKKFNEILKKMQNEYT